ncbi:tetratricopeptide repeat protein [Dyadobacter chenwenxiniae]|uniref:Tetratricopeptide repeat protein n=1 Tax=Dyadobacter chenwenxiniae TaxID=2906456 RepID=A0A9X1PRL6_9BACT|nr:tetratricopeptide repeat protein [Dyadobacter chenwenxiniae]MCF0065738.1 tetratricopeptide repeat protein [Dyadobacter chenwenxiniae]UON82021.1 tetratricopeptide repeat protein [Dyadobacter chenwenxiniae]
MKKVSSWVLIYMLLSGAAAMGQTEKEMAEEYFKNNDCPKALTYYTSFLKTSFEKNALKNYTSCIIKSKAWGDGEQFFKKQIKNDAPNASWYNLYWGVLLEGQGKAQEATKKIEQSIAASGARIELKRDLADEFRALNKPEWAKQILIEAREAAKRTDIFQLELASVYRDLNAPEQMIDELLSYGMRYQNIEVVQNMLQDFTKDEKEQALLEKVLYDKIQKFPSEGFYNELLIWYQIQKKDFYKAFIQERSLDKRFKHNGSRLYNLGMLALQNLDYSNAGTIFDHLVKEYPKGQLYPVARRMAIFAREEQVKNTFPIRRSEVQKLLGQYQQLVDELGVNVRTVEALRNMAILNAFYMDDFKKAIEILNTAIEAGKQEKNFVDKCKLDLGDIYLLQGEPWEATLVYSQVEKSQKDDLLGYEAKLRNAKLHYFKGEFELAKAVLDILKKATSREIANDANELSLLIMDNTGLDSTEAAMKQYSSVELMLFQNKKFEAIDTLKGLFNKYQNHSLADEILWLTAKTYIKLDSNQQAMEYLKVLTTKYGHDIYGDDALFASAKLYQEKLKDKDLAMKLYQELMEKYPGSIFVAESRKRFRLLRGDVIN